MCGKVANTIKGLTYLEGKVGKVSQDIKGLVGCVGKVAKPLKGSPDVREGVANDIQRLTNCGDHYQQGAHFKGEGRRGKEDKALLPSVDSSDMLGKWPIVLRDTFDV